MGPRLTSNHNISGPTPETFFPPPQSCPNTCSNTRLFFSQSQSFAAFLVGLSKGGLPSVGTLAVPLMALVISPVTAAALLLPIYVISDMFGLYLYRHHFSARNLAILTPAAILGVGVGWMFSAHLSPTFIGMLVGLVGILFCFNAWFGARYRKSARKADVPRRRLFGALSQV